MWHLPTAFAADYRHHLIINWSLQTFTRRLLTLVDAGLMTLFAVHQQLTVDARWEMTTTRDLMTTMTTLFAVRHQLMRIDAQWEMTTMLIAVHHQLTRVDAQLKMMIALVLVMSTAARIAVRRQLMQVDAQRGTTVTIGLVMSTSTGIIIHHRRRADLLNIGIPSCRRAPVAAFTMTSTHHAPATAQLRSVRRRLLPCWTVVLSASCVNLVLPTSVTAQPNIAFLSRNNSAADIRKKR